MTSIPVPYSTRTSGNFKRPPAPATGPIKSSATITTNPSSHIRQLAEYAKPRKAATFFGFGKRLEQSLTFENRSSAVTSNPSCQYPQSQPPQQTPASTSSNTVKMTWFGITPLKKFPAPIMKPLAPFFAAGLIIAYGINSAQNAMMQSDEWKNDPRNPNAKSVGH